MWFVPIVLSPDATVVADDANLAAVAPRYRRDVRGREALELAGDLALDVTGELPGRGDKDRGRGRPVLRLAKQVGRDELRVGGFVRDHQDLGRAGEKVDSDATKQLPLRRDDAHLRGGDHRIAPARNIRACARDRDVAMPERDARKRLQLDVQDRRSLGFREPAHLSLGETDVLEHGPGDGRDDALDLRLVEAEALPLPPVETRRPLLRGRIAPLGDVRDDGRDRLLDLARSLGRRMRGGGRLRRRRHRLLRSQSWDRCRPLPRASSLPASARARARASAASTRSLLSSASATSSRSIPSSWARSSIRLSRASSPLALVARPLPSMTSDTRIPGPSTVAARVEAGGAWTPSAPKRRSSSAGERTVMRRRSR